MINSKRMGMLSMMGAIATLGACGDIGDMKLTCSPSVKRALRGRGNNGKGGNGNRYAKSVEFTPPPTNPQQILSKNRNLPCKCGSGLKVKKCDCWKNKKEPEVATTEVNDAAGEVESVQQELAVTPN